MTDRVVAARQIAPTSTDPEKDRGLPDCWLPPATSCPRPPELEGEGAVPWDWSTLSGTDVALVWRFLEHFVAYLNARYLEAEETKVPPCWPYHGGLVEDLTTLACARAEDFASGSAAHNWHHYALPGFRDRMREWLGDSSAACRGGNHRPVSAKPPSKEMEWARRRSQIARLDTRARSSERPLDFAGDGEPGEPS